MKKAVTLADIARKSGVSVGTIDRVIHKRGRVSKETEDRVQKILDELDYKPNILARSLSLARSYHFAVMIPDDSHHVKYWQLPQKGIEKAKEELRMYNVRIHYYPFENSSRHSFVKCCEELLKEMPQLDGLLLAPILSDASRNFLKKIPPKMPYVFFDSYIPDTQCLTYIGQDAFQSGVQAGRLMEMMAKKTGSVAIVRWIPQNYNINKRVEGFMDVIRKTGQFVPKIYDADREKALTAFYTTAEQIWKENPDLRGIFIPSDCASEVADFLKTQTDGRDVVVIGYDLTDENTAHLKEGIINSLISQRPEQQGYQGIFSLFRHVVLKESVDSRCWMPIDIITKENVDYYHS